MDQAPQPRTRPSDDVDYYASVFWNDLPLVQEYINEQVSGDPSVTWSQHFARTVGRTFERALVIGCGDGRIEREVFDQGLIASAVGVDVGEVLERARALADGRPFEYLRMDFNEALPDGPFDLVLNNASGHHVTYVDRVFRGLCERLTPDGWLLAVDYVGPHRNQYPGEMWLRSVELEESLPAELQRGDLRWRYPHLPTMIAIDPTEGVHPELVPEVMARYFDVVDDIGFGGAIGYEVLTHNQALHGAPADVRDAATAVVLAADARYLRDHPDSSLFSYVTARPRRDALGDTAQLARWTAEEVAREEAAAANGGMYYDHAPVADLYHELERRRVRAVRLEEQLAQLRHDVDERDAQTREHIALLADQVRALGGEVDDVHNSMSWRVTAPLRAAGDGMRRARAAWRGRSTAG